MNSVRSIRFIRLYFNSLFRTTLSLKRSVSAMLSENVVVLSVSLLLLISVYVNQAGILCLAHVGQILPTSHVWRLLQQVFVCLMLGVMLGVTAWQQSRAVHAGKSVDVIQSSVWWYLLTDNHNAADGDDDDKIMLCLETFLLYQHHKLCGVWKFSKHAAVDISASL